ncbi:hypothetical protein [Kushneria aurantia]|uniref:Uncharacterized protein n=1 Tax=Kushneria aurantia TaxID=504092 RepID=A0ABV6G4N1_9GAMM|nr:hypothetical protein [Kushneria aurantia]
MKKLPGMLIGTLTGLLIWMPTQMVAPAVLFGIVAGVVWDLWRQRG